MMRRLWFFLITVTVAGLSVLSPLNSIAKAEETPAQKGEKVFEQHLCAICHTIRGKGGKVGPDLSKVGERRDEAWLMKFLPNPTSVEPGTTMPPFQGSKAELEALVAYLNTLK